MFLSPDDLRRLTGKRRHKAQARVLTTLGIRYILAGTGEPLVRDADLDGKPRTVRNTGPRLDLVNG